MTTPFRFTRRGFLIGASAVSATATVAATQTSDTAAATPTASTGGTAGDVPLHWIDGAPATTQEAAFGVPWPKSVILQAEASKLGSVLAAATADGTQVPVQSWPLAYWPDGSVKWTGHALGADQGLAGKLTLSLGAPAAAPSKPVTVTRSRTSITLDNGVVRVVLGISGTVLLKSITSMSAAGGAGRVSAQNGQLILLLQNGPDDPGTAAAPPRATWTGRVEDAQIEQSGPVRAVVRLSGTYRLTKGAHNGAASSILPWTVRVYLSAGADSARLKHSFVWDVDPAQQLVRGLGLQLDVPISDETHNRHVRFATSSGGVWGEAIRGLTGIRRDAGVPVRSAQIAGTATPPVSAWPVLVSASYTQLAEWNDFSLFQESASHYAIWKRTSSKGSWLTHAGTGERASGFGYVGGVSGGLGFGISDFWQQFPRSIDITGAATAIASVTLWSWSPHAPAMDLRHYDTTGHGLDLAYEDVQAGFSTPVGIVRSSQFHLFALAATPSRDRIAALGAAIAAPPQVVAEPEWLHGAGVFGRWSLPDSSTPGRARLEKSVTSDIAFYAGQIEQRNWYGFWHYGDVMHTYDQDRHVWRYDEGGYAWDNAELGFDAALWYAFLRTGDARTFRLANALTRHVAEVDSYHAGPYAGLGTRHGVIHWGDGAKEARVGESFTKRFAYYLTTDELLGELLHGSLQAATTLLTVEPLREVLPVQTLAPTRLRIGPDWYALVSNWLTEWERTGDTHWRDLIVTGMNDIAGFPAGLYTGEAGGAVGFDPATGHLTNFAKGDYKGGYNLAMAFCGNQILWEVLDLVAVPAFRQTLLDFARYAQATSAEKIAHYGFDFNPQLFPTIYSRLTAWAGEQLSDPALRTRGWNAFLTDPVGQPWPATVTVAGTAVAESVTEIPLSVATPTATNDSAQRTLAIIELLAIAPGEAPV